MRGVGRFRGLLLGFFISILTINVLFVSNDVSAETLSNSCLSAELRLYGPSDTSIFNVWVKCNKPVSFVEGLVEPQVIPKILLNKVHPTNVGTVGSEIKLTFRYVDFSSDELIDRVLSIDAGVIKNLEGTLTLLPGQIDDKVAPVAIEDINYYIHGSRLVISKEEGLLDNDTEHESSITIVVDTQPSIGTVVVNADGSFIYEYNDQESGFGDDIFSYHLIDGSNNFSETVEVHISDAPPEITGSFYNAEVPSSRYAKTGDRLVIDFLTSEYSIIDKITICGNKIYNYENYGNQRFSASYKLSDTDNDGSCSSSIILHDVAKQVGTDDRSELEIIIDNNTVPVIYLQHALIVDLGTHESFDLSSEAAAYDITRNGIQAEELTVAVSGFVDFDRVGNYVITYQSTNRAGLTASAEQVINITDSVNDKYTQLAGVLLGFGIVSNLSQVNVDNYRQFSDMIFEKSAGGKKVGRITFFGPIDLSVNEESFMNFADMLNETFVADSFGEVGMDLGIFEDQSLLMGGRADITFFNLNEIGYSNGSRPQDIISNLLIYNDTNEEISANDIFSIGSFTGCSIGVVDCYAFIITVSHFSKYVIAKDNIAPIISINKIKNYQIGELITFTGTTDDVDARIIISIDGRDFEVPQINIKNGEWYFAIDSNDLGIGKYMASVVAYDFGKNQSARVDEEFMINKAPPKPESSILSNILTQTASVVVDSPSVILGDKIKGETKSIATVVKIDPEFGLDKQELGLIFIVVLLGIVILVVDRQRK